MRKYQLYVAGMCAAIILGADGCAAPSKGEQGVQTQESPVKASQEEDAVVEKVAGDIEPMDESESAALESLCVYGPVTILEDGSFSIDNQSGVSMSGEMILTVSTETTYILDAVSGLPVKAEDIRDGDAVYAYIGPAMTTSLPPVTNAEVIFTNVPPQGRAPEYVTIKSMITNADTSQYILTAADGTEYTLTEDCNIFPYLTRNIVTLDDLTAGRKCVVWADEDGRVNKLMLFAQ